jgi:hypothetical protein
MWKDITLLERIRILSTISGGTFTGIKYVTTIKKGGTIRSCYKDMYRFMSDIDLVNKALGYLSNDSNWSTDRQRSLINSFASVYHKEFEPEHFELLWKDNPEIHLKEISFTATEFNFGIPFRFQKTELSSDGKGGYINGYIGNNKIRVPIDVAKEIRLADILASSSCFPLGFEPINFPNDFIHAESKLLKDHSLLPNKVYDGDLINYPVGLMDGGIDDNQGVDAVFWAEQRMQNYPSHLKHLGSNDAKVIDLYIISDVSSPYMESYIRSATTNVPFIGKWKIITFNTVGLVSIFISIVCFILVCFFNIKPVVVLLSILGIISVFIALISFAISKGFVGLATTMGVPRLFARKLRHFDTLNFQTIFNLIKNRGKSAMTLVSDVFMKQVRRYSYSRVYSDKLWSSRLITNAIYELTPTDVDKRKIRQPNLSIELSQPGKKIMDVSLIASSMGTTLWFSNHELSGKENMLNSLIACGQYTICFNLLEYIEKCLKDTKCKSDYDLYSEDVKYDIEGLYQSLMIDWKKFQNDPYWMVNEWNKSLA